jgi:hypothetical protein
MGSGNFAKLHIDFRDLTAKSRRDRPLCANVPEFFDLLDLLTECIGAISIALAWYPPIKLYEEELRTPEEA